jgi:N-acetylmuramoyl-L-alanine amidase
LAIKIFIDQGHNPTGRHNAGAQSNGLFEQNITYSVGIYLSQMLEKDSRFQVQVSRTSPDVALGVNNETSLAKRVLMANAWPADCFLSIHVNASENTSANGTECYVFSKNSNGYPIAERILDTIVLEMGTKRNGVLINPSFYVLRNTSMPAVLIELAYITNSSDSIKLRDEQYQFARAIFHGIEEFYSRT